MSEPLKELGLESDLRPTRGWWDCEGIVRSTCPPCPAYSTASPWGTGKKAGGSQELFTQLDPFHLNSTEANNSASFSIPIIQPKQDELDILGSKSPRMLRHQGQGKIFFLSSSIKQFLLSLVFIVESIAFLMQYAQESKKKVMY